ncbi:(2Fe-2S) ferredoxin domain-containing protein [Candidatus Woesearchaeota archaeon]|nr:(2Fe-2S) ferredoxin domain-containing protein [Candidatus Woesearchaeota archaeon]
MERITNLADYKKHVFVCVNKRTEGQACCSSVAGEEIFYALKYFINMNGLAGRVFVTKTGCLGYCNRVGATVVIYPERAWFKEVTMNDLEEVKKQVMSGMS